MLSLDHLALVASREVTMGSTRVYRTEKPFSTDYHFSVQHRGSTMKLLRFIVEEAYLQILKASGSGIGFSFNAYRDTDYNPLQNWEGQPTPTLFSPSAPSQVAHVSMHERSLFACLSLQVLCPPQLMFVCSMSIIKPRNSP